MKAIDNYKQLRSKIRTGDIYFTSSKRITSRIVQFFTRSKVSHCGVFVKIGKRLFVVDVDIKIRMLLASEYFKNTNATIKRIHSPRSKGAKELFITSCLKDLGMKYDVIGAIMAPFTKVENRKFFCSEFVAEKLHMKFKGLNRGILPIDLYNASKEI